MGWQEVKPDSDTPAVLRIPGDSMLSKASLNMGQASASFPDLSSVPVLTVRAGVVFGRGDVCSQSVPDLALKSGQAAYADIRSTDLEAPIIEDQDYVTGSMNR